MTPQINHGIQAVRKYFETFESRLGYDLITFGAKHFGYYPSGKPDIPEKKAQELMQDLLINKLKINQGQKILDAGCGEGVVACYVSQKTGCNINGITIIPFEVKKANNLAGKFRLSQKVHFSEMDYVSTSFPSGSFDAIYTMESLVHSYDLEKTLKEFWRLLKPGGKYADFGYSTVEQAIWDQRLSDKALFEKWMVEKAAAPSFKKMHHGELVKLLETTGFVDIAEKNITVQVKPSVQRLTNIARIPYFFINLFGLQNYFVNATMAAAVFPLLANDNLFRYNITVAKKPLS